MHLISLDTGSTALIINHSEAYLMAAARKSPTEFYMHQVIEHDPLEVKNIAEISVTPVVTDFANALRIDQTAMQ